MSLKRTNVSLATVSLVAWLLAAPASAVTINFDALDTSSGPIGVWVTWRTASSSVGIAAGLCVEARIGQQECGT